MRRTLSLTPRTHFFIKDDQLFIKLQRPNYKDPMKADLYIMQKLSIEHLKKIRDWADTIINNKEGN